MPVIRIANQGEARYLRLGADGKVYYITAAEVGREEVLARPRGELSAQDIIVFEWNDRIKVVEELMEQISAVYQLMGEDVARPSQHEPYYKALWDRYRDAIEYLRELDPEWVSQFQDRVTAKVIELGVKINAINDSENLEKLLASYEKNFDLSVALARGPVPKSKTRMDPFASYPGELTATTTSESEKVTGEKYLSKVEFNICFLWELTGYPEKVARGLLRECKHDIKFDGWHYAQRRWAKFIHLGKLAEVEYIPPPSKASIARRLKRMFKEEAGAREPPVCDYGDGSVTWANCLPCPLYKDGHCTSKRGIAYRATHKNQLEAGEETGEIAKVETKKPSDETTFEHPQIPIEKWIEHHREQGIVIRGPDGQVIDWLWCLSTWDKLGRPVVYAAPRDPFYDLSLYFYPEKLSPQKLQGIVTWLEEHSRERR